jgi:hypothetical protein
MPITTEAKELLLKETYDYSEDEARIIAQGMPMREPGV